MEFWVSLIVVAKEQSLEATKSLKANCTYVDNQVWIFEGDIEVLREDGVRFNMIRGGAVPSLGDMSKSKLVALCKNVLGIDVYNQNFEYYADLGVENK